MSKWILRWSVVGGLMVAAAGVGSGLVRGQAAGAAGAGAGAAAMGAAVARAELTDEWKPLFNGKNLDGFYTFLSKSGKNKDAKGIFKAEEGMIHIMDLPLPAAGAAAEAQETGYLSTEKAYGDFDIRLEYKWGTKRFAPRATQVRDSGCHYLFTGPDKIWEQCIECQIEEGDTGDAYLLGNVYKADVTVKNLTDREKTYLPAAAGGVPFTIMTGRIIHGEKADTLTDWNTVEVIVKGNSSTQIVNGKTVNVLTNICLRDGTAVKEGKIAFQSEAAEMWYRNIEIRKAK